MVMTNKHQNALQKERDDTALAPESQGKGHKHDLENVESAMVMNEMEHKAKLHHTQALTALKCETIASRKIACLSNHLA